MFCFKGTVSQDFLLQVFSWIVFPQASENPQILGLTKFVTFADLPHVGQFADKPFADPIFFAICGFVICWPKFITDLQLLQIWKFKLSFLANWKLVYIPWLTLLKAPPPLPTHTHKWRKCGFHVQYRGNVLLWPKSNESKKNLVLFYLFTLCILLSLDGQFRGRL